MKKFLLPAVMLIFMFLVYSCNVGVSDDAESSDVEDLTSSQNDNITMTKLVDESHSVDVDERVEVRFTAVNIADTTAADGEEVVIVGYYLCDSTGTEYNWNNNGDGNLSSEFVSTVTDSSVSFTFYYDSGNDTTDFKIFANGTWDSVVTDYNDGDGNIKVDLSDFCEAGDVVEVVLDASVNGESGDE